MLEIDSKEDIKEKLKEGLIKVFEGEGVKVNVEDSSVVDAEEQKRIDEEKKRIDEEKKNKEIKDKKIEELSQQYEAVTKLQGDKDKEISELKAQIAALQKTLEEKEGANANMMKQMAEAETANKMSAIKSFVKDQVTAGKLLPKDEGIVVALMGQLDDKSVVKFSRNDQEVSESMLEVLKKFISDRPKTVEFSEIAPQVEHKIFESKIFIGGVNYEVKDQELVQKAEKYAQDNKVEFDVALMAVSKEREK